MVAKIYCTRTENLQLLPRKSANLTTLQIKPLPDHRIIYESYAHEPVSKHIKTEFFYRFKYNIIMCTSRHNGVCEGF